MINISWRREETIHFLMSNKHCNIFHCIERTWQIIKRGSKCLNLYIQPLELSPQSDHVWIILRDILPPWPWIKHWNSTLFFAALTKSSESYKLLLQAPMEAIWKTFRLGRRTAWRGDEIKTVSWDDISLLTSLDTKFHVWTAGLVAALVCPVQINWKHGGKCLNGWSRGTCLAFLKILLNLLSCVLGFGVEMKTEECLFSLVVMRVSGDM